MGHTTCRNEKLVNSIRRHDMKTETKTEIQSVEVKNVKIHDGLSEETMCFEASIYINGKRVGTSSNRGKGACNDYHFKDMSVYHAFMAWAEQQDTEYDFEKADEIINGLVCKFDEEKHIRRACKKQTHFRLKSRQYGEDGWSTIDHKYDDRIKEHLKKKYGDDVIEILNDRFAVSL